jgi:transmembrane sensor
MDFNNTPYTIPDLLTNQSFLNFYFQHNENDVLDWEDWQDDNAERTILVSNAVQLLDKLSLKWNETEIKKRFSELKQSIDREELTNFEMQNEPKWWVLSRKGFAIAASFLVIIALSIGFFIKNSSTYNKVSLENKDPNKLTIYTLADGSKVHLHGKSTLNLANDFNETNRIVYLTGEAFFDVAKNADKPFLIYTGDIVTKVLGTSFTIKSPEKEGNTEGGKVEVEVVSGKVSVFKTQKDLLIEKAVVLTPNQKVTYRIEKEDFIAGIVEKPIIVKEAMTRIHEADFRFEETPLSEVLKKLETAYGIQIVLSNDKMNTCPLTANLTNQPLFGKLDLICAILKANHDKEGTHILITGRGCE